MMVRRLLPLSPLLGLAVVAWVVARSQATLADVAGVLPLRAHALALAAFAVDMVCRAGRLVLIARGLGRSVSFRATLRAQLAGDAAGAVTPSRAGSDPARVLVLHRDGLDVPVAAAVLMGEMLCEVAVLGLVVVALVILGPSARTASLGALLYAAGTLAAIGGALFVARLSDRNGPPNAWTWVGLGVARWRWLRIGARRFLRHAGALRTLSHRTVAGVVALTFVHYAARLAVLPAFAAPFASGDTLGPLLAWPLLLLYAGAVLPPPGGAGVVELGFVTGLRSILPPDLLAGAMVWWRVYTYYLGALLGALVLTLGLRPSSAPPARTPGQVEGSPAARSRAHRAA